MLKLSVSYYELEYHRNTKKTGVKARLVIVRFRQIVLGFEIFRLIFYKYLNCHASDLRLKF